VEGGTYVAMVWETKVAVGGMGIENLLLEVNASQSWRRRSKPYRRLLGFHSGVDEWSREGIGMSRRGSQLFVSSLEFCTEQTFHS
jgi:hypothetical protein